MWEGVDEVSDYDQFGENFEITRINKRIAVNVGGAGTPERPDSPNQECFNMNTNQKSFCRKITANFRMVPAVWAVSLGGQDAWGQDNLLQNGTFPTDLSNWDTEGDVTGGLVRVTLSENGTAPLLY